MAERGITENTARRFRLGLTGPDAQPPFIRNRLAIPYLTEVGAWHIKYRCIEPHVCKDVDGHPKYIYTEGHEQHLFNARTLLTAERVVVTEGELDAVAVEQCGAPAVGFPGATTWMPHWAYCFDSVEEVIVVGDGDKAGEQAARTVSKALRDRITGVVRSVVLPAGHDSNSYIFEHGDVDYLSTIGFI